MYKINNKTQPQIRRLVKKLVKEGNNHIYFGEKYNEKTRKTTYSIWGNTYGNVRRSIFDKHDPDYYGQIDFNEFDNQYPYFINDVVKSTTGKKFEEYWPDNETLEKYIQLCKYPYY